MNLTVRDWPADRWQGIWAPIGRNSSRSGHDCAFRRPIIVHHVKRELSRWIMAKDISTGQQTAHGGLGRPWQCHEPFRHRRWNETDRDLLADDPVPQGYRIGQKILVRDIYTRPDRQIRP